MPDRRLALLDAAVEQIARHGTRAMRVDAIAKSVGSSTSLIYHHFGDRATLLQEALAHIGRRAAEFTPPDGSTGREQLIAMVLGEISDEPAVRTNSTAWGELRGSATFDPGLLPTLKTMTDQWNQDYAETIRLGQQDGSIDSTIDPNTTAITLSTLVEGFSGRWLAGLMTTNDARESLKHATQALLQPVESMSLKDGEK